MPTLRKLVWKPKVDSLANTKQKKKKKKKKEKKEKRRRRQNRGKILQLQYTSTVIALIGRHSKWIKILFA